MVMNWYGDQGFTDKSSPAYNFQCITMYLRYENIIDSFITMIPVIHTTIIMLTAYHDVRVF